MPDVRAFPWDEVSAFAFGVLRLSPVEFWEMTPRELVTAMQPFLRGRGAPSRVEFDALMQNFPDKQS
jgi:uncharacterized phage protein (TIGR02216 family)